MKKNYPLILVALVAILSFSTGYAQSKLSESSYNATVKNYLLDQKQKYNLSDTDIADLYLNSESFSKSSNVTNLYINQQYRGIKVFNAVSSLALKNNKVIYFANNFYGSLDAKVNTSTPSINSRQAILNAVNHFGINGLGALNELSVDNYKHMYSSGNVSQNNIPVELVLQPMDDTTIRLAWDLSIYAKDGDHWWNLRVDAVTGDIIEVNDWVVSCDFENHTAENHANHTKNDDMTSFNLFKNASVSADGAQYNVFALPVESPNHGQRSIVTNPANDLASPFGWHDTNGSAGAEFTITRGNNVYAYEDLDGAGNIGTSPDATSTLNFDYPLNLAQAPVGYLNASLTNLFYMNNMMHDVYYQYGFDESSGNFQTNNYGNGGTGFDAVSAVGQDGTALNNANFATPPEGLAPRMRMYLWNEPTQKTLVTVNSSSVAGPYVAVNPASTVDNNLPGATTTPVTADLVLAATSGAVSAEGCTAFTNAANVAGKIVLIVRGTCPFVDKIQNAQNAGAVGVIIMNHNNPANDPTYTEYVNMAGMTTPPFTIPSVFINNADGQVLLTALQNGETLNTTLLDYPTFQFDGSFDNGIVAHEYGHGISNRLTGGAFNSSCLNNGEQMGEGWSDWFALMLTMKDSDTSTTLRGIATYSSGEGTSDVGIRPTQYTTDTSINNITYGATNDDTVLGTNAAGDIIRWNEIVHNIGYIWGSILWDLNWALIDKYGFDSDVYNGTGGNNRAMQLVIDGLKLQPCRPGFVTGRDAILAADMAISGGEDQCLIWEVFANRGLGIGAAQGTPASMVDQTESFDMPPASDPSLANCTSLSVGENDLNNYKIYPNPTSNDINIVVNRNYGKVEVTMFDLNGRKVFSQQATLERTLNVKFGDLQSGIYIMNIQGDDMSINEKVIIK